jgi:hypothetical protein
MRRLWIVSVPVLVFSLVGCGDNQSSSQPVAPTSLTTEQVNAELKEQKETAAAEKKRLLSLPKIETEHWEGEAAERARHQERKKSAPKTAQ